MDEQGRYMPPLPTALPQFITHNMTLVEIGVCLLTHYPSLNERLDWIVDEEIDGRSFQVTLHVDFH